jgi:hypothetical protein
MSAQAHEKANAYARKLRADFIKGLHTVSRYKKHGLCRTKIYYTWYRILARCHNPKNHAFKNYGGRGIYVCDEWRNSFKSFLDDMGVPEYGMHLDRIDNDGPYAPWNCRWATPTQNANNRRSNRVVMYLGCEYTISELAREFGIPQATLRYRIMDAHWDIERAVKKPVRTK